MTYGLKMYKFDCFDLKIRKIDKLILQIGNLLTISLIGSSF